MAVEGDRAVWRAEAQGLELLETTIGTLPDRHADEDPEKEALVYHYPELGLDMRPTQGQYRARVDAVAKGLLAIGIAKGEHIAVWASNLPEWIFLQLAAAKIGAVLITVNTVYRAPELEYILGQGGVTALFLVEEVRGHAYLETLSRSRPHSAGRPATPEPARARDCPASNAR